MNLNDRKAIVVTSVSRPTEALLELARKSNDCNDHFIVIGDETSPQDFSIPGCNFYNMEQQFATGYGYARQCPVRHYARKNIGYLLAIERGASQIIETDDDNIPLETFWQLRQRKQYIKIVKDKGWVNVYGYFTEEKVWPRGFPLESLRVHATPWDALQFENLDCPIQQGLADHHPDVDAVYNLTMPLPRFFKRERQIALKSGAWCPFNSQNTTWWPAVYPLLYLPAYCSFRLTDIWRSFIAQRIAWENGWCILFHGPTVWQNRNEHDLMKDFSEEVPGYINNSAICNALEKLPIKGGVENVPYDLRLCYEKLVSMSLIGKNELLLLDTWLDDLKQIGLSAIGKHAMQKIHRSS